MTAPTALGGLQSRPRDSSQLQRIESLPPVDIRNFEYRSISDQWFQAGTDHQGIAYLGAPRRQDEHIWLLSSNDGIRVFSLKGRDAYRPEHDTQIGGRSERELLREIGYSTDGFYGVTQIAFHRGLIFAPVETNGGSPKSLVLALSLNLKTMFLDVVGYSVLPSDIHAGWCAINPWDERLYMARGYEPAKEFVRFDASSFYDMLHHKERWGQRVDIHADASTFRLIGKTGRPDEVHCIQGICFSPNGRLYVATYEKGVVGVWHNFIRVYSVLTGVLQSVSGELDVAGLHDEIEGLALHPSGVLYVAVCINRALLERPFAVYAFRPKDPSVLV